jgi:hypothetical protein
VLYRGDNPGMAATRVHAAGNLEASGLEASALNPISLIDAMEGRPPVLLGSGEVSICAGAPSNMSALRGAVERAESGISYMEVNQAAGHLRTGKTALICAREPVHPDAAARLFYLEGVVLFALGNETAARVSFQQALTFQPGMSWDDYIAPDALSLFEAVGAEQEGRTPIALRIAPLPAEGALWVNGQPVSGEDLSLPPGHHLVQVVGTEALTIRLRLDPPTAEETPILVVPGSATSAQLAWAQNVDQRGDLDLLLQAAFHPGESLFITVAGRVWQTSVGTGEWEELEVPTRIALGSAIDPRQITSQTFLWGGTGVAVLSGFVAGFNYLQMNDALRVGESTDSFETYESGRLAYEGAVQRMQAAAIVAVGGVVLGGTGYFLRPQGSGLAVGGRF